MDVFQVELSSLNENFTNQNVEGWDSIKQLCLTSSMEDAFDLLLDAEDIVRFSSYEGGKAILIKNGIEF